MALSVYNVRTRRKEPFAPRDPRLVGLYVCGLTVYDHVHIGHARTYTSFEVIRRWLEHRYGAVHHVMNVTDVDDKIIARAKERNVSPRAHAAEWDAKTRAELETLGIQLPSSAPHGDHDDYPHVTTSIADILRFIAGIVQNGFAYATAEGNVYFDVPGYDAFATKSLKDLEGRPCGYGSLSNRDFREMAAGTRKDVESDKRHPADFALWKAAEPADHPDASWDPHQQAPDAMGLLAGIATGRPGWHIECSLMSTRALGDTFDIHGGGQDLIFPHHENEIAQSQAKTGKAPFVDVWMHTGFLNVEGEKMSKSLNNFITLQTALDKLDSKHGAGRGAEILRFYFLQTHYRSKIDFSWQGIDEAAGLIHRLAEMRGNLASAEVRGIPPTGPGDDLLVKACAELAKKFEHAMDDDFHTPGAIAALSDFQRAVNILLGRPAQQPGARAQAAALDAMNECERFLTLAGRKNISFSLTETTRLADGVEVTLVRGDTRRPYTAAGSAPAILRQVAADLGIAFQESASEASLMALLMRARERAREANDWARSDEIRKAVKAIDYPIIDNAWGQSWRPPS